MASFTFTPRSPLGGEVMPMLPLQLAIGPRSAEVSGMIDTAASVNVLPFSLGAALGAIWEEQQALGTLAGALSRVEIRGLPVLASNPNIEGAQDVSLLFAWANSDEVPVLLGQTNFFMEFNVCFYRSRNVFEVWRRD